MNLDYHPGVPRPFVQELERSARRLGLPLHTVELIGQDAKTARDFLRAVRAGHARAFVDALDERALERRLSARHNGRGHASPLGLAPVL